MPNTLAARLAVLERSAAAQARCYCFHVEQEHLDGTVENPTAPLCPHGQPWWLVMHMRQVPRGATGGVSGGAHRPADADGRQERAGDHDRRWDDRSAVVRLRHAVGRDGSGWGSHDA